MLLVFGSINLDIAAAALACTRPGAQAAQPGRAEIDALLARHAGLA